MGWRPTAGEISEVETSGAGGSPGSARAAGRVSVDRIGPDLALALEAAGPPERVKLGRLEASLEAVAPKPSCSASIASAAPGLCCETKTVIGRWKMSFLREISPRKVSCTFREPSCALEACMLLKFGHSRRTWSRGGFGFGLGLGIGLGLELA